MLTWNLKKKNITAIVLLMVEGCVCIELQKMYTNIYHNERENRYKWVLMWYWGNKILRGTKVSFHFLLGFIHTCTNTMGNICIITQTQSWTLIALTCSGSASCKCTYVGGGWVCFDLRTYPFYFKSQESNIVFHAISFRIGLNQIKCNRGKMAELFSMYKYVCFVLLYLFIVQWQYAAMQSANSFQNRLTLSLMSELLVDLVACMKCKLWQQLTRADFIETWHNLWCQCRYANNNVDALETTGKKSPKTFLERR